MTSPAPKAKFHHGDLKRAALLAAHELVKTGGWAGLSLRGLAAQLGVNHRALYRHYADKDALLQALAGQQLDQLLEHLQSAQSLEIFAARYIDQALDDPHLYQLMFAMPLTKALGSDELLSGKLQSLLKRLIECTARNGENPDEQQTRAVRYWAMLHGLLLLFLQAGLGLKNSLSAKRYVLEQIAHLEKL